MHSSIRAGNFQGTHVLRFLGDVRVTLCGGLDAYCERMVKDPDFHAVVIDLEQTENLDSTALGCLARLSIRVKKLNQRAPTLICNSQPQTNLIEYGIPRRLHDCRSSGL